MGVDGGERTFTRLEEAWSDPGYVRIESCTAATAEDEVELTPDEEAVASVAAGDGDTDPLPAYLAVLAACVRIPPDRIAEQPRSLLEGVLLLCPEAPHADLVAADLQSGGRG
ncbi:hypothetical protein MRBLWH7_002114 [Microbacterium sp. LWH7-1.2]|jgi:hypothetical protein|uniref:hypothetical protein n=1 Tax=Microbacterium sp. LWH7-1.2 TaxID=3135257 RepID=UPI0031391171